MTGIPEKNLYFGHWQCKMFPVNAACLLK